MENNSLLEKQYCIINKDKSKIFITTKNEINKLIAMKNNTQLQDPNPVKSKNNSKIFIISKIEKINFKNLSHNMIRYIFEFLKKAEIFKAFGICKRFTKIMKEHPIYVDYVKYKKIHKRRKCLNDKHCKKLCKKSVHDSICIKDLDLKILQLDIPNLGNPLITNCYYCAKTYCNNCILRNLYKCIFCKRFICKSCVPQMNCCGMCNRYSCKSIGSKISTCYIQKCSKCNKNLCRSCLYNIGYPFNHHGIKFCYDCSHI